MKKNGFISTTLIYTFFIIFLILMIFLLNSYSRVRYLLGEIKTDIRNNFSKINMADINLNIFVWNSTSGDFEISSTIPENGYLFQEDYSYCRNGGKISFEAGEIVIKSEERDFCYAYFGESTRDINLRIYTRETANAPRIYVNKVPSDDYKLNEEKTHCDNGGTITFDPETRKFKIDSTTKVSCEAEFIRIKNDDNKDNNVDLIIMIETATGDFGITTGKKYSRTGTAPTSGYYYAGSICDNSNAKVIHQNGVLSTISDERTTCKAYFEAITDSEVRCENGSIMNIQNNLATIESSTYDLCKANLNGTDSDIIIDVYVMNRKTQSWDKYGKVPTAGYELYNAGCSNGANIEYVNGKLKIATENSTTCTVYFR